MGTDTDVEEREWDRLVEQLSNDDCTPFLGAGASSEVLPTGAELGATWAQEYDYPFDDPWNLPEVMQYATIIERDPVTPKQRVVRHLSDFGEPDFDNPTEPHALLARFPLTVYLTTNYDDFMTRALRHAGKQPVTTICPWYRGSETDPETWFPSDYQPGKWEPLVYHLHGSYRSPSSLVLTQQDYVEFLVKLVMDRGIDSHQVIPIEVLPALTQKPLLFIGYSLRDSSFRTLFHGLVRTMAEVQHRRHISVQLKPLRDNPDPEARRRAEEYLTRSLEKLNISVYWGSVSDFCTELARRAANA